MAKKLNVKAFAQYFFVSVGSVMIAIFMASVIGWLEFREVQQMLVYASLLYLLYMTLTWVMTIVFESIFDGMIALPVSFFLVPLIFWGIEMFWAGPLVVFVGYWKLLVLSVMIVIADWAARPRQR